MTLPQLGVEVLRPPPAPEPLRTDVVGVVGRTRRGPTGVPVRVPGLREFTAVFGGPDERWHTPYAARGYFANGGQVAHVLRPDGDGGRPASGRWSVGERVGDRWAPDVPAAAGFPVDAYRIEARTPGTWADGTIVTITHRAAAGLDVRVEVPGEVPETLRGLDPADLPGGLDASVWIRAVAVGRPAPAPGPGGPSSRTWPEIVLADGADPVPGRADYLAAARALADVEEVALVVLPDVHGDLDAADAREVLTAVLDGAARLGDRLVLLDVPAPDRDPAAAAQWVSGLRDGLDPARRRAAAAYHPWLRVPDPLGGLARPLRAVPPAGHVAGLASRLDRVRGAGHTPANALLADAHDLDPRPGASARAQETLHAAGLNPVRCRPGGGIEVWGGRTLDAGGDGRYVAHQRLLHRLVRAIRRVAEPLVFAQDSPELRLALVRGLTSVLLEAHRSGALAGARPEESFSVRCDDATGPPPEDGTGLVVCEIEVAPVAPLEFVRLRLSLAPDRPLEVVEA